MILARWLTTVFLICLAACTPSVSPGSLEHVSQTGGAIEYRQPNRNDARAVFIASQSGSVFVDCSSRQVCKARRSWRAEFSVQYYFDGSRISDFQDLDRRVIDLLATMDIRPLDENP